MSAVRAQAALAMTREGSQQLVAFVCVCVSVPCMYALSAQAALVITLEASQRLVAFVCVCVSVPCMYAVRAQAALAINSHTEGNPSGRQNSVLISYSYQFWKVRKQAARHSKLGSLPVIQWFFKPDQAGLKFVAAPGTIV
jgi:hypothetical protein